MKKSFLSALVIIALLTPCSFAKTKFIWPIDRPKRITGTFGEFRGVHFHNGIDVSCSGKKGFKIYAANDGYVSSVMYSRWGIGYGIFMKHAGGMGTIYGHMERFSKVILNNSRVKEHLNDIRERKNFRIDFKGPEIKLKRGTVIGYSGDSGIGREHLHFELRKNDNDLLNPLINGFSVKDRSTPVIKEVYLVPLDGKSHVNWRSREKRYRTFSSRKRRNRYWIRSRSLPVVAGKIGIKIGAYDRVGYKNRVALYSLKIYIGKKLEYSYKFDRLKKGLGSKIGVYYDYDRSSLQRYTYYLFNRIDNSGVIRTDKKGKIINVKIVCTDAASNRSYLNLRLRRGRPFFKASIQD